MSKLCVNEDGLVRRAVVAHNRHQARVGAVIEQPAAASCVLDDGGVVTLKSKRGVLARYRYIPARDWLRRMRD